MITSVEEIRLTNLSEVEKQENGKVFALNTTSGAQRGNVILVVGRGNGDGGADTIVIPASWVPFELTTLCPLSQLVSSNNLRITVSKGHLRLLNADDCIEFLQNSPEAQAEVRRIRNFDASVAFENTVGDLKLPATKSEGESDSQELSGAVSSYVQLLLAHVKDNEGVPLKGDMLMEWSNRFRSMGDLTLAEYKYVNRELAHAAPTISKLAAAAGKKLQAAQE